MNSTDEMKIVRDYLRRQVKRIKLDPYLSDVAPHIEARILKWNKREHSILVCVRDTRYPETPYNSNHCRWVWTQTWCSRDTRFWKWEIWRVLNDIVCHMRHNHNQGI